MHAMTPVDARLFDLPREVIYLNTCGAGPRLHAVNAAARRALSSSAHAGSARPDDDPRAPVEALRQRTAETLGTDADALAYCPSVSYGMSTAALNLTVAAGQNVVVVDREHPSNHMAWQHACAEAAAQLRTACRGNDDDWTAAVIRQIDARTAVVCVPQAHWIDGRLLDLERIACAARAVGAALVIDASQSLGLLPMAFETVQPDFVIAPGHKWLLGAYGLGWLWAAPKWRAHGQPLERSIAARQADGDFAALRHLPPYREGARRFDFGAHAHPIAVPMALAAITQMQRWGLTALRTRVAALITHLEARLAQRGLADGLVPGHAPHFCAWVPPRERLVDVTAAVRDAGCIVACRAGALRIAPYLHVDEAQLDHLVDTLARSV